MRILGCRQVIPRIARHHTPRAYQLQPVEIAYAVAEEQMFWEFRAKRVGRARL